MIMKTNKELFAVSKLTLAVRGALIVMLVLPLGAYAEDAEVAALTQPTNSVEVGVGDTTKDSAKFGEYNGLDKKGANLIGNFKVRGGDAYKSHDGGEGVNRWEFNGTDLGTTSRELGGTYSKQGQWDFGFKYDELRHNFGSIQTPQQGSMGGNSFVVPQGFGIVDTANRSGQLAPYGTQALTPTQKSYFHTVDVYSDRKKSTLTIGHNFDQQWGIQFEIGHLEQGGAKLISSSTDFQNKSVGQTLGATAGNPTKEAIQMLMNPTNYTTDTFNLALNWLGDKGHFTGSYYLSQFKDGYNGLSFSNPMTSDSAATASRTYPANGTPLGAPFAVDMLSTAPDNFFQQLNLNGGYNFTQATKLVGGVSYGRNTQDMAYINQDQMQVGGLPQSSLNGLVITKHADLKLINQTTKDLALSAGLKFNDRDNRTASNTYKFYDLGGGADTSISTPLSNKKTQFELAADYRLSQHQKLNVGLEHEQIHRWCDSSPTLAQILAVTPGPGGAVGNGVAAAYYANGASCVQVPNSTENKLVANYHLQATDDVNLSAGYSYGRRRADVNTAFYNPMQAYNQGYELPGTVAYFDASRNEQMVKAGINWQATEKLNVGLNGRYVNDDYSALQGVQKGNSWSANLDAGYYFTENTSATAYVTVQNRKRDLDNATWSHTTATFYTLPASQVWTNTLSEDENTVGINAKQGGLMGGKLDMTADLTYSLSKSGYTTTDNYVNAACTAVSTSGYACGSTPDIKSELIQFKLAGDYKLNKASKVRVGYLYQNLKSTDYYYNAYQMGYTPTSLMPTNQQAPSYSVNVVTVSYSFMF
jgi:MtrB/PioB family decaheme-associated outer membrane protein